MGGICGFGIGIVVEVALVEYLLVNLCLFLLMSLCQIP